MLPLVLDMVQTTDPSQRPNMDEVVQQLDTIVRGLSNWRLRTKVVKKAVQAGFYYIVPYWLRRIELSVGRASPIPVPS